MKGIGMRTATFILGLLVALIVAAPASASASVLDGWWPFYEGSGTTAHDLSGNRDDGTLSGNVQWTSGYFGLALSFDGVTGRVDVPNNSVLEPTAQVTASAYVKANGSPGDFKYILAKGASTCTAASYALYTGPNGGLMFYISQDGGTTFTRSADAGAGIWDGNWHLVVGTYDGSAVHLYVDGKEITPATPQSGPIGYGLPNGNDLFVGHYDGCSGLDFAGSVDEPTVWSKAWSPLQVSTTYNTLSALHGWTSRLPSFPGPAN
jgi:hypothetical protein